jgi:hypothetical protein
VTYPTEPNTFKLGGGFMHFYRQGGDGNDTFFDGGGTGPTTRTPPCCG